MFNFIQKKKKKKRKKKDDQMIKCYLFIICILLYNQNFQHKNRILK